LEVFFEFNEKPNHAFNCKEPQKNTFGQQTINGIASKNLRKQRKAGIELAKAIRYHKMIPVVKIKAQFAGVVPQSI
jgi:hypothetical protein